MQGFILTRHWRDTANGIALEFWLSSPDGPIQLLIPSQQSIVFVRESDQARFLDVLPQFPTITIKPLALKNYHGEPVVGVYAPQQKILREFCLRLNTLHVDYWESDIRPPDRFLMERFVTSSLEIGPDKFPRPLKAVHKRNYKQYSSTAIKSSHYHPTLRVVSVDIETSMDARDLFSIAVYSKGQSIVFMVDDSPYTTPDILQVAGEHPSDKTKHKQVEEAQPESFNYIRCESPKQCLQQFLQWIDTYDPDILIGWHVVQFDCWVLTKLCERWKVPFTLGRNKKVPHWRTDGASSDNPNNAVSQAVADTGNAIFDGQRRYIQIAGRVVLDGIELLRTAFYHFDSFSLQFVANALLGEGKLLKNDDRGQAISDLFLSNKRALAEYNLQDCKLVWDIFEKTELLDFALERARLTGLPLDKMGGSVASFDYAYLPRLHRKGYVAPNLGELQSDVVSPGGYVMRSLPGLYRDVLVLDFKSLYPSIIRTFTIDPYAYWVTQHNELAPGEMIEGFNDARFAKKSSILPELIHDLWQERDLAKQDNNKPLSQAIKIIMNSFYGVLGSQGCRFFDPRVCSSITLRGHEIIQLSQQWIESQGYRVIYGDTDSVFVWLGETFSESSNPKTGTDEQALSVGRSLAKGLNVWWTEYLLEHYDIPSALEIEFETHYQQFLMPTIRGSEQGSKKRYAGMVLENGQQKMIFKGLESVRADWTPLAKDFQQRLYKMVFAEQPYRDYIRMVVAEVLSGSRDHDMVYRKRLRRPLIAYQKSTPPHIKAARKKEEQQGFLIHKGESIDYVITLGGPESVDYLHSRIDYQHYIDKQLKPIADSILCFLDDSFDRVIQKQFELL